MMRQLLSLPVLLLVGCGTPIERDCGEFDELFVWVDADGDGFGQDEPIGYVCAAGEGEATNNVDCDDTNPAVLPGAKEVCDLVDNDCNNRIDETEPKVPWYHDLDGDTFGSNIDIQFACKLPGEGWLETSGDCDDTLASVNPLMIEVCNEGLDDDCDTLADDSDGGVDPASYSAWYRDADADTFGDVATVRMACAAPPGAVANDQDCDDEEVDINPNGSEICDRIDNDCDGLTDDEDDSIDPTTQDEYFADADGDGYGDAANITLACESVAGFGVDNPDDCDDTDPLAYIEQWWGLDLDADGAGDGASLVFQCLNPGVGTAPEGNGIDCEPNDPTIFPLQPEDCFDGIDQNCNNLLDCDDSDCASEPTCVPPCADDVIVEAPALPMQVAGSTVGQVDNSDPGCLGNGTAPDVAYHFVPTQTRMYTFNTFGSGYDTSLYVRSGCGPGADLACNDDSGGLQSQVQVNLTAGTPVLIIVDGFSSNSGNYVLNIQ